MRAGLCIGVLEPHISALCFFSDAAAAVPCRLYHTVPQLSSSLLCSHGTAAVAQQVWTTRPYLRVLTKHMRVCAVRAMIRERVCRCVHLRAGTPHFSFAFLFSLLYCCRIMSGSHRAPTCQVIYFVAATAHSKLVWATSMRSIAYACVICACRDT